MARTCGLANPRVLGFLVVGMTCWPAVAGRDALCAQPGAIPLSCDAPVAGSIDTPSETDEYSFSATDGDIVQISVIEAAGTPPAFAPQWRLLTAGGTAASVCGLFTTIGQVDCGPLPASGNPYRIEVIDNFRDATGGYTVHLYRLPAATACETVALACQTPVTAAIDSPLDSDFYSFTVTTGDIVEVSVIEAAGTPPGFAPVWRLLTAAGTPATDCGLFTTFGLSDCGPLPASGNPYRLEVIDNFRDSSGTYTVQIDRLPAATACESVALACDVAITAAIDHPLDKDFYSFAVVDGDIMEMSVVRIAPSSLSFAPVWRLVTAAGTPASDCGLFTTFAMVDCGPLPASGNPYRIEIADNFSDATGAYRLSRHSLAAGCPSTPPFTISGQVRDLNDTGIPDVTMTLSGTAGATMPTDANGQFAFTNLGQGGSFTVTPSRPTFVFAPPSQTFPNLQSNQTASFVATSGTFTRYLSEGATGAFFDTQIALLNATNVPNTVTVRFQRDDGVVVPQSFTMGAVSRATVDPEVLPGLEQAAFATVVESTQPVIVDRLMRWDATGYGSHAETSVARPETVWYLAEGATTGSFSLFYLLQNPSAQDAEVQVRYLRPAPLAPITRSYTVRATSRLTIFVNDADPALDEAEVSAVITSTNAVPIVVERAMYTNAGGRTFGAGHESAAANELATSWFLAEGATGPFFHLFILVVNPGSTDAALEARYLLPTGTVVTRNYVARANSRLTISVHAEGPQLANTPVSTTITSTDAVPVLVERAMWWPATAPEWYEGHNSAGAVATGEKWGLALGEAGGADTLQTYILIANTSATSGTVRVRLVFEDGTVADRTYTLLANSRFNVFVNGDFPAAAGRRFGAIVESLGTSPVQIVVERAIYGNAQGVVWAAGANALGTRLR